MVKLIFLDLDGVLVVRFPGVFEPQLVRNLKMVVDATGAEIVLSSDWRRTPAALEDARRNLRSYGIDCIGYTPCLSPSVPQRPREILMWKDDHHEKGGSFVTAWIAIDDRPLLEEEKGSGLRGHFVHTDPDIGFEGPCIEEAIHLLNRGSPGASPSLRGQFVHGCLSHEGDRHTPSFQDPLNFDFSNSMPRTAPTLATWDTPPWANSWAESTNVRDNMPWAQPLPPSSSLPLSARHQPEPRSYPIGAEKSTFKTIMPFGPREDSQDPQKERSINWYAERKIGWSEVPNSSGNMPRGKMMDLNQPTHFGKMTDLDQRRPRGPQVLDIGASTISQLKGSRPSTPRGRAMPKVLDMGAPLPNREYRPSTAPRSRCQVLNMQPNLQDARRIDSKSRPKSPAWQSRQTPEHGSVQGPFSGRQERMKDPQIIDIRNVETGTPTKYNFVCKSANTIVDLFDNRRSGGQPAKTMDLNNYHGIDCNGRTSPPAEFTRAETLDMRPRDLGSIGLGERNSMPKEVSTPKRGPRGPIPVWDFRY